MKFAKKISRQPRKIRKAMYNADIHELKRKLSIHLSRELRKSLKRRSELAKKGDKVRVIKGEYRKREGKIIDVDVKKGKIYVEGIIIKKQGGKEKPVPITPSICILMEWIAPREKERKPKPKPAVQAANKQVGQKIQTGQQNATVSQKPKQPQNVAGEPQTQPNSAPKIVSQVQKQVAVAKA